MILTIENGVTDAEKNQVIAEEEAIANKLKKEIATLSITIEGEELVSKVAYKSRIIRYARITGYVVPKDNMSQWKQSEVKDRVRHC